MLRVHWCLQIPTRIRQAMAASYLQSETKFLPVGSSKGELRKLAYHEIVADSAFTVMYIPGFTSCSQGHKPKAIFNWCKQQQVSCITYDPSGFGEAQGASKFRISEWLQDAEEILTKVAQGPVVLVGSSMGAWISCMLAERHQDRVRGALLLSAAPNFGDRFLQYLERVLPGPLVEGLRRGDTISHDNVPGYGHLEISMGFFEDMKKHYLCLDPGAIKVSCPVRMLHTEKDRQAPFEVALQLFKAFDNEDVQLQLLRTGTHSLYEPESMNLALDSLLKLLEHCRAASHLVHNKL